MPDPPPTPLPPGWRFGAGDARGWVGRGLWLSICGQLIWGVPPEDLGRPSGVDLAPVGAAVLTARVHLRFTRSAGQCFNVWFVGQDRPHLVGRLGRPANRDFLGVATRAGREPAP